MSNLPDYLTKQLFIEKNVVTYRSLSRAFNLHVNEAKNELASFLASPHPLPEQPYATYLISGEPLVKDPPPPTNDTQDTDETPDDPMDVDSQQPAGPEQKEEVGSDVVSQTMMILVGQSDLENARAGFKRIYVEHVYCLSPSALNDADLICAPSAQVYQADAKISAEASTILGRVIGPHVHVGKVVPTTGASSSKVKPELVSRPGLAKDNEAPTPEAKLKPRVKVLGSVKKEVQEEDIPVKQTKSTGRLDWSKAKPRAAKEKAKVTESPKVKEEENDTDKELIKDTKKKLSVAKGTKVEKPAPKPLKAESSTSPHSELPKRGIKRKSALQIDSDSDSESRPTSVTVSKTTGKPARGTKRKSSSDGESEFQDNTPSRTASPPILAKPKGKKVILSDDEDNEQDASSRAKGKGKAMTNASKKKEQDQSLKAMFDIDDDEVIQGSTRSGGMTPVTESQDEDVDMEDEIEIPKPLPKKKKGKKVVPIGRNGLKKKRVVKQKTFMDDSGYMVTEDYSSYESVDEEEEIPKTRKAGRPKNAIAESSEDAKPPKASLKEPRKMNKASESSGTKKAGSGGSKLSGKGSIQNFFGKK